MKSYKAPSKMQPATAANVAMTMLLLFACLIFTQTFNSSTYRADGVGVPEFERLIPTAFGDWRVMANNGGVVDPEQEAAVRKLYTTTLNRTYLHRPSGRQVMLSIGYGKDQSHVNQVHTPEQCYPSQGFIIDDSQQATLASVLGPLPVTRLHTHRGVRAESLTYWLLVGDRVVRGSLDVNLERIWYSVRGQVVDGLIFRVSEVVPRNRESFDLQNGFVSELLTALAPDARYRVIGARLQ